MVTVRFSNTVIQCEDVAQAENLLDKLDELFSEFSVDGTDYYFDFVMEE